jgi:hypothetical protein
MREMQCREQGRLVAGIECGHEAVEHSECCAYCSLVGLGLSLVDVLAMVVLRPVEMLADDSAKDAHIVAAGDLSGLLWAKATAQHRRNEMHPLGVIRHGFPA